jgi:hypothetical protein
MARRVRFFSNQIEKEKDVIPIRPLYDSAPLITVGPRAAQTIDELDVTLTEHESRLVKMNESYQTLSERTKELIEARHVLRETAVFFDKVRTKGDVFFIAEVCLTYFLVQRRRDNIRTLDLPSTKPLLHCYSSTTARRSTLPRTSSSTLSQS